MRTEEQFPIEKIEVEQRGREDYGTKDEWDNFKQSIHNAGLLMPIVIMEGSNGHYKLLAGGRRLAACQELNHETIRATIVPETTRIEQRAIEILENVQRKELTWQERDAMITELHGMFSEQFPEWTQDKTARMLGVSQKSISDSIQITRAAEKIPQLAESKNRTTARAKLSKLQEKATQRELAKRAKSTQEGYGEFRKKLCDSYIISNSFDATKALPDNLIHFAELDPPYGVQLGYRNILEDDESIALMSSKISPQQYYDYIAEYMHILYPKLKDNSWVIVWCSLTQLQSVSAAITSAGLVTIDQPCIWYKQRGSFTNLNKRMQNGYECFVYAFKGNAVLQRMDAMNVISVKSLAGPHKVHPTEKPIALYEEILPIFTFPGSIILSPFLGSGNIILAAHNFGASAFGFDLSKSHKDNFTHKVNTTTASKFQDRVVNNTEGA